MVRVGPSLGSRDGEEKPLRGTNEGSESALCFVGGRGAVPGTVR